MNAITGEEVMHDQELLRSNYYPASSSSSIRQSPEPLESLERSSRCRRLDGWDGGEEKEGGLDGAYSRTREWLGQEHLAGGHTRDICSHPTEATAASDSHVDAGKTELQFQNIEVTRSLDT